MMKLKSLVTYFFIFILASNVEAYSEIAIDFRLNPVKELFDFSGNGLNLEKYISARRGGSFGGFRSRSRRTRSSSRSTARSATRTNPQKTPSFGGTRMSSQQAKAKYGTPRRVQAMPGTNAAGAPMNYNVHHYGGFSSSLMTGYMLGNMTSWMMMSSMLYTRPVYVENEDGSVDVYPPTFDWGKLLTILLVIGIIVYFVRGVRRAKKNMEANQYSQSSFS